MKFLYASHYSFYKNDAFNLFKTNVLLGVTCLINDCIILKLCRSKLNCSVGDLTWLFYTCRFPTKIKKKDLRSSVVISSQNHARI